MPDSRNGISGFRHQPDDFGVEILGRARRLEFVGRGERQMDHPPPNGSAAGGVPILAYEERSRCPLTLRLETGSEFRSWFEFLRIHGPGV